MMYAYVFICVVIVERLAELIIATRNESWMKKRGAIEVGEKHHKLYLLLHGLFFLSLAVEFQYQSIHFYLLFFIIFMLAQVCRVWCIMTLGKFWNTKTLVFPNVAILRKGPYKYMKHPNDVIVFIELFMLPAMFGAFVTASLFPLLHMVLLSIRIPMEERTLSKN